MPMPEVFTPTSPVKLVIWDLDDTFWAGTLSEGGVTAIARNVNMVKTLADRGIMSSICSKNEFDEAKNALQQMGVWNDFVFPHIGFSAKGEAVKDIIDVMNLRPDNVLFIDDNRVNLEEIRFLLPTIMAAHPDDVLPRLLLLAETKGKDDSSRSRLKQYKRLEQKANDFRHTTLSNVDFLRQCEIKIRFCYNVEVHLDRVIELINRSNQLNFTKRRLETPEAVEAFKTALQRFDVFSSAIFVSDKYGDHGLVGFYTQAKTESLNKLIHFVFSCRIMNMGVEQFVYDEIGQPAIDIVPPVSNPIRVFDSVDWIQRPQDEWAGNLAVTDERLVLLGSCDLTAVATYCSRNRIEYVNGVKNGTMTRYDDFGFLLNDRNKVDASTVLDEIPCWSKAEFSAFQSDLQNNDILILSLSAAMKGAHIVTDDGVVVRVHPDSLGTYIDLNPRARFLRRGKLFSLDLLQSLTLLNMALNTICAVASKSKIVALLGANTRDVTGLLSEEVLTALRAYNAAAREFCSQHQNWRFVPIDDIVDEEKLLDDRHYTRTGYLEIANYISKVFREMRDPTTVPLRVTANPQSGAERNSRGLLERGLLEIVTAGRPLSRGSLLGPEKGYLARVKRSIKLSPFSNVVRAVMGKARDDPESAWR